MKLITCLALFCLYIFTYNISFAAPPPLDSVLQNFDAFPATGTNEIPRGGDGWQYSSYKTNINPNIARNGWYDTHVYGPSNSIYNMLYYYLNTYNSAHMGFETYGYMEIDGTNAAFGNSLKITVTGGKTLTDPTNQSSPVVQRGLSVLAKEDVLAYQQSKTTYIDSTSKVGMPIVYFVNNSVRPNLLPFPQAQGKNRLSLYAKLPNGQTNGVGGYAKPVEQTLNIGPFNDIGGHWYDFVYLQGGSWAHILVDGHPQHNNAFSSPASFPYPSSSVRDYGVNFFNPMYRWYIALLPTTGVDIPPYNFWLDEIGFTYDSEPQNNETINTLAVSYSPGKKSFEISFNDKYVCGNGMGYATYELRYSFSPITNANWSSATPVYVQTDTRFGIISNTNGQFKKWSSYYRSVWAPFKIAPEDEPRFIPGTTIYFAVKDVSQSNGDGMTPVASKSGRDYSTYPSTFDYEGDKPALPLIKRIDFYFSEKMIPKPVINGIN